MALDANKIEKFIDAGYTKAEIELLFKDPKVDPEPEPEPKQEPEKKPEEKQGNDSMEEAIKSLTNTVNALSDTVKAMQTANIDSDKTENNKDNTIEGVMQSFIEKL